MKPLSAMNKLGGGLPCIIIDTREQTPLAFEFPSVRGTLPLGDYSFIGGEDDFAVERKSISDLCGCVTHDRERFEREMNRLRGYRFRALLVCGTRADIETHNYRSQVEPSAVLASLTMWHVRYGIAPVFCATATDAARQVELWAWYAARGQRHAGKAVELVELAGEMREPEEAGK